MTERVAVDVGGHRVRIRVDGKTGPVVVLCSGLGGRALHWSDTATNLANDHTVVRFDRPGTPLNGAPAPAGGRTIRGEADRIAAVLDAVHRADPAVVVGHSIGGFFAEAFARLYPQRTGGLLLLDSSVAAVRRRPGLPPEAKLAAADITAMLLEKLHLRTTLSRAGLAVVQRRRPGGLDAPMRSEIRSAAAQSDLPLALLTEQLLYHELVAELLALRADCPLPPVRRLVVTAHTGWRTYRWRTEQIRMAETLAAEHMTVSPAGHLIMIEKPSCTADLIRALARTD